jgi:hypothetical protein
MDSNEGSIHRKRKKKPLHKLIDAATETKDGLEDQQKSFPRSGAPTLEDIREALVPRNEQN